LALEGFKNSKEKIWFLLFLFLRMPYQIGLACVTRGLERQFCVEEEIIEEKCRHLNAKSGDCVTYFLYWQ
jgi:hypothetical protein